MKQEALRSPQVEEAIKELKQDLQSLAEPRSDIQRMFFKERALKHLDVLIAAVRESAQRDPETSKDKS